MLIDEIVAKTTAALATAVSSPIEIIALGAGIAGVAPTAPNGASVASAPKALPEASRSAAHASSEGRRRMAAGWGWM